MAKIFTQVTVYPGSVVYELQGRNSIHDLNGDGVTTHGKDKVCSAHNQIENTRFKCSEVTWPKITELDVQLVQQFNQQHPNYVGDTVQRAVRLFGAHSGWLEIGDGERIASMKDNYGRYELKDIDGDCIPDKFVFSPNEGSEAPRLEIYGSAYAAQGVTDPAFKVRKDMQDLGNVSSVYLGLFHFNNCIVKPLTTENNAR